MLKSIYENYFKMGVACERINGRFTNHEIGNPSKEALIIKEFNSMTCANELKPAYNMGFKSPDATETNLPFCINENAKYMLDFAKSNHLKMRGHVLVWHSQCPKEIFCKGYEPVTFPTDPKALEEKPFLKFFEKLNPVCFVDRQTMLLRLKSYIFSVMDYMYQNGYANVIYAWDVVNEAIELEDKTPLGLRNSYWYQVIGDDFIYWAFRYAKDAVLDASVKYAHLYGVDAKDPEALKTIKPSLFYNDYNEWHEKKKEAIIGILSKETSEHGSVIGEKLIDGIGMQGHLSDNNDVDEYIRALRAYGSIVNEVQVTELDVKCTCGNVNAEYYQAVFYKKLFTEFIKAKKDGINLTSVTVWGLTDDNSWIHGANPLLFRKDLSYKKSYDALVYALSGESLGEPVPVVYDISDRNFDFEPDADGNVYEPEKHGFKMKGFGPVKLVKTSAHSGAYALAHDVRFDNWSAIMFDVTDFIGQTIDIKAYIKTPAKAASIFADIEGVFPEICQAQVTENEWSLLHTTYKVPNNLHSLYLGFRVKDDVEGTFYPMWIDDISISLVGMEESFEEEKNCAAIRGMGHLPVLMVTDKESVKENGHSLLVTRQEKDATVKFNIAPYLGKVVTFSAFVKTKDTKIIMGIDGATPIEVATANSDGNWVNISGICDLTKCENSAEIYIATNGNADYYIDDIFVKISR